MHLSRGLPFQFAKILLKNKGPAQELMERFKNDIELWQRSKAAVAVTASQHALVKRHLFNKISMQQFIEACTELNFKIELPLIKLVVPRVRGVLQAQIVEDIIGCQKTRA